jgi:hypothetical protein
MKDLVKDGAGFAGVWYMDRTRSRWWDYDTEQYVMEPVLAQTLRTQYDGEVFESWCSVKVREDLITVMHYRVRFDDEEWAPYTCIDVQGPAGVTGTGPSRVLKSGVVLNEPIAFLKQVWVDERTQYRTCRNPDGSAQYVMQRRLNEDRTVNTGTCMGPDGINFVSKVFTRHKPADGIDPYTP